jgi:multidrug efflux system membrane fusion protein
VAAVVLQDVSLWDEFSGRLEAVQRVDIRPRVAGAVQAVHFREGALVKPGICWSPWTPRPMWRKWTAPKPRWWPPRPACPTPAARWSAPPACCRKAPSPSVSTTSVNAQREADANLRAAQAALQTARLNLGYTQVRAPVAGRVGRIEVTVGNLVAGAGARC